MSNDTEPKKEISEDPKLQKNSKELIQLSQENSEPSATDLADHRYACRSCGYVYDPEEGVKKFGIPVGTSFLDLDPVTFFCPVCRIKKEGFRDVGPKSQPSGFKENLNYGFGVNTLTEGQKNVLIFGGLAFAIAIFLSLYSLH